MPTKFPQYDDATDSLIERDYYDVEEVAALLHVSASTVHRRIKDGRWDALRIGHNRFMSAAQIGAAMEVIQAESLRRAEPEPLKLGEPVADVDLESLR